MPLIKKLFSAFGLVLLLTIFFLPQMAKAQVTPPCVEKNGIPLQVSFPLPNTDYYKPCSCNPDRMCISDIGAYISTFYIYFAGVAGILATVMIVYAGFIWITAAGNSSRIEKAKSTMNGAFIGLVLTLTSYIILRTINPELVKLRMPPLSVIKQQVLATNFCKDMPTVSGVTPVADAESIPCGKKTSIDKATADKAGYTQDYCCGSFCPQNLESPQICASMQGMGSGECPETCADASYICTQTDKEYCDTVNDMMQAQGVTTHSCRKADLTAREDKCRFSPILACPQASPSGVPGVWTSIDWKRVSCAYFGSGSLHDTPCWSVHNPEEASNRKCTDYKYPAQESDGICCAAPKKEVGIECKDECDNHYAAGNHEGEVEVSCNDPILGNSLAYNAMSEPYDMPDNSHEDRATDGSGARSYCASSHKCCLRLMFYIDNTPISEK